VDCTVLDRRTE
jgi:hypothetical protein